MQAPPHKTELARSRFLHNMGRISGIVSHRAIAFRKADIGSISGPEADMMRAVIVFLHATFEQLVRDHSSVPNKKITLYSKSDIVKALNKIGVDPDNFADLLPALSQMAKRRSRIVHHADLDQGDDTVDSWSIVDHWQLIHWLLSVATFHFRLLAATGCVSMVEARAGQNTESALLQNVAVAKALIAFPKLLPERRREGLLTIAEMLEQAATTLSLEVRMFLDPDGKPIENAI